MRVQTKKRRQSRASTRALFEALETRRLMTNVIANSSFETPALGAGAFNYSPSGSSWTFAGMAGIQSNGSAYSSSVNIAPDGTQTALLQGAGTTLGSMSQVVSLSSGSYSLMFYASQRWGQTQPIKVTVDGTQIGSNISPASNSFAQYSINFSVAASGNHTVKFEATDNTSDKSSFIDIVTLDNGSTGVPGQVTGLTATAAGSSQINLSWTAVSGATSYNVYRSTTSGGEGSTPIASGITGSTFSNTGLSASTTYYYKVAAVNGSGTGSQSAEASATTQAAGTVPGQVTGLSATATSSSQINLGWTAVSGATSYNIYRSTTAGGEGSTPVVTGITGSTYSDTGLNASTTYYYKVAAVNASGTGAQSAEASATTQAAASGTKRTGTVIGSTGTYQSSPAWDRTKVFDGNFTTYFDSDIASGAWAGLDLGSAQSVNQIKFAPRAGWGSRMVGGKFQASNTADFSSGVVDLYTVTAAPTEGSLTTANVTSATYRYYRYLSAPNGWGNVSEVEFWDAGGTGTAPSAPTGLSATAAGSSQINLAWTDNSNNESGFKIERATDSAFTQNLTLVTTTAGNATSYSNTGLSASTTYYYRVRATNANGDSANSNSANATTQSAGTVPGQVTGLSATAASSSQINLSWTAVSGATSYNIYRSTTSGGQGSTPVATGITGTTYSDSGLSASTAYYYKVAAVNASGTGTQSAEASATTQSAGTGTQRTGTVIGTTGTYGGSSSDRSKVFDGNLNTYMDSDVPSAGWAGLDLGSAQTVTQIKYAPRFGWASRMVGGKFQASNTADFSSGVVDLYTVSTAPTESVLTTVNVTSSTYRYFRYLSAPNGWANVAEVEFWDAAGSGSAPSAPTGLSASAVSSSQINLSWSAVSGATSYNIYRSTTPGGEGSTPIATNITTTSFANTGLTASTTYYYKVAAVNSNGTSSQSSEASATTTTGGTIPGQVTGLSATATSSSQINLSWTAVSGATSYNVYRSTTSGGEGSTPFASGITGTTYSNTGLSASTTYYYKVAAVNAAGTGTQSSEASATTQAASGGSVPRIIFDSDMSSDWDDVGDIAVVHGLDTLGEVQIIGMMVSSQNGGTALAMDAINTYYGEPNIPIGVRPDIGGVGGYPGIIASEFPHDLTSASQCPLAVNLYRQLLASSPDKSVIIATTGYLNNLQALLQSGPDQYSSLNGIDLVKQKVKVWACAGGAFPSGDEFNFRVEPAAAYYVINNWPTAVTYTPFDVGQPIYTAGRTPQLPTNSPIRRVYVDIENDYPYPSWGQVAIMQAVRGSNGLFGEVNVGRNNANPDGHNFWTTTPDPTGADDQKYLTEVVRTPVRETLDALLMLQPNNGTPTKPGDPSDLRSTAVGTNEIDLSWTDNSYNETGFIVERRNTSGTWTQIATVGANVTHYNDTTLSSVANTAYRVEAYNAQGQSVSTYNYYYTGWTESSAIAPPAGTTLYTYYQHSDLRWDRGGDFRPDHVTLNNDSQHGQNLTISVDVSALGAQGTFYVYFFYQNQNNWYRLNFSETNAKFEKNVNGTISQIGSQAAIVNLGNGSNLQNWRITVNPSGQLTYTQGGTAILSVTDALSFTSGKIGLGGVARTPVWENFWFSSN